VPHRHEVIGDRSVQEVGVPPKRTERHFRQRHYDQDGVLRREDHYAIRETPMPRIRGPTGSAWWLAVGLLTLAAIVFAYAALLLLSVAATWGAAYLWGIQAALVGAVLCLILSWLWGPCGPLGLIVYHVLMAIGVLVAGWFGMAAATVPASIIMLMGLHYGDTI
jgi:hypothetical protein